MQEQPCQELGLQNPQYIPLEVLERGVWWWSLDPLQMERRKREPG